MPNIDLHLVGRRQVKTTVIAKRKLKVEVSSRGDVTSHPPLLWFLTDPVRSDRLSLAHLLQYYTRSCWLYGSLHLCVCVYKKERERKSARGASAILPSLAVYSSLSIKSPRRSCSAESSFSSFISLNVING